jgi:hypothetical protein
LQKHQGIRKRQYLIGLFKTSSLAYFAATTVTTVRRHGFKGFDVTNILAYFVTTSVTTNKDIPIKDFPE